LDELKNKSAVKKVFLAALIILVFISFFIFSSCKQEPFLVEKIILSKGLDSNNNPTEETDSFQGGTKEIYLVIRIQNMKSSDSITVKWTYLDEGLEIDSKSFTPEEKFNGNKIFIIKIAQGFPFGNYEANIFVNGSNYKTIPFTVK